MVSIHILSEEKSNHWNVNSPLSSMECVLLQRAGIVINPYHLLQFGTQSFLYENDTYCEYITKTFLLNSVAMNGNDTT